MQAFKSYILFIVLSLSLAGLTVPQAQAEVPVKGKVMMSMALYGTGGGALLGFASMAFGAKPISIARGASLGLYAGILFGGYIILSYHYKSVLYNTEEYPTNGGSGGSGYGDDTYNQDAPLMDSPSYFRGASLNPVFDFYEEMATDEDKRGFKPLKKQRALDSISVNILSFSF